MTDDPRVKLLMLFNIGIFDDAKRYLIKEIKAPIGYFLGGVTDFGAPGVSNFLRTHIGSQTNLLKRQRKTTSNFQQAFQLGRVILTPAMAELTVLQTVERWESLQSTSYSGKCEEMPNPKLECWIQRHLVVSSLRTGKLSSRIGHNTASYLEVQPCFKSNKAILISSVHRSILILASRVDRIASKTGVGASAC
jgi:hypothetical protein